jgi:CRP-like cAMP-binding protein
VKGRADVTVGDIIVERAEAGTILGELALIEQVPRSADPTLCLACDEAYG